MSGTCIEKGEPDTTRDVRGFAMKLYTEEGNWDLMCINTPVFLNRDMKSGPDGVHAMKKDPRSGLANPTMTWDFIATHPESLHFITMIHTDMSGTPTSYRNMHAYGCNTFSFINAKKERFWVKFHLVCQQETKGFDQEEAKKLMGEKPDLLSRDLYEAIHAGNFPKWKLCFQMMPEAQVYQYPFAFDPTKVWPKNDFPLTEIGIIELNKNPVNYHNEVEQVTFSPARVVPGISYSPDRLLQGRLLVYDDTQKYRVGAHHNQLFVNRPHGIIPNNNYYGGPMNNEIKDKFPHYWPSTFGGPQPDPSYLEPPVKCDGPAGYYDLPYEGSDADYYAQVRDFFNLLTPSEQENTIANFGVSLKKVTSPQVVTAMLNHLTAIDPKLGSGVKNIVLKD